MAVPWADQPFALIQMPSAEGVSPETHKVASEMSLAHNLLLRVLNSVHLQCTTVTLPTDIQDFLIYAQTWHDGIHHHHHCEETIFFPMVEELSGEKDIMEKNISQHDAFHPGLEAYRKYVYETKVSDYDGEKLRAIIDDFGGILTSHLNEEIGTLLGLEKYGGKNLLKLWISFDVKIRKTIKDKYRSMPMGLGGIDRTVEGGKYAYWPAFPWFVPYLAKWVFYGRYKGSWRFSPCTLWGVPRILPFAEVKD